MTQEEKKVLAWYNKTYETNIVEDGWEQAVDWYCISQYQTLSESFIEVHKDRVNWFYISQYQSLSESFIEVHKDRVNWFYISQYQSLSESFIAAHKDLVNWLCISQYQSLSEPFIAAHKDRVNWRYISKYQTLSEPFIAAHKDLVYWPYIHFYQILSKNFFKKHAKQLHYIFEQIDERTWLYASEQRKIDHIRKKAPEFEVKRDEGGRYILAYKATHPGGRSKYKSSIRYEVGKTYEARCDHDMYEENSFGLSAWTEEGAKDFIPDGELYRVKIYIQDIGAMVHDGKKIRCKKQTFVERVA